MGIAPQGHETAPQPDPALDKLPTQDPDPNSWDFVEAQVQTIRPGDATRLQIFLEQYPQFHDRIIALAQSHLGNAVVHNATSREQLAATMHGPAPTEDVRALLGDEAPANAEQAAPAAEQAPAAATTAPAAAPAPTPDRDPHAWESVELRLQVIDDAASLAVVIKGYPQFRDKIITAAETSLGKDLVKQAISMADAPAAARPEAEAEQPVAAPAQAQEQGPKPGDKPAGADQLVDPAINDPHMPAWASKALEYNYYRDEAKEFDALTGHLCAYQQDEFMLNPIKVAAWQKEHDLVPDGKVGPKTIAAARALHKLVQEHPEEAPLEEQLDELGKA